MSSVPTEPSPRPPALAVVVVTYNSAATILPCLDSILASGVEAEVVVVDNASTDGTPALVAERFPSARLIVNEENEGFGRGCNLGWLASEAPLVLLLNPDSVLHPGAASALMGFARAHPGALLIGPRIVNEDGSLQHSCFRFPSLTMLLTGFFETLPLDSPLNGRYRVEQYGRQHRGEHLLGACLLVRREPFGRRAPFDERFFMYFEETDLCYRARQAGWENWYIPDAVVTHLSGHSTAREPERMSLEFYRSQARFYRKHYGLGRNLAFKVISALGIAYWTARSVRGLIRRRIDSATLSRRLNSYRAILLA